MQIIFKLRFIELAYNIETNFKKKCKPNKDFYDMICLNGRGRFYYLFKLRFILFYTRK